jgi:hypothetical protein
MTKPTLKSARLAALDKLTKAIIDRLQAAGVDGLTIPDLNEGLTFAKDTIRSRLFILKGEGRVYRKIHTQPGRNNVCYTWHLVGAPASFEHGSMRQTIVREYPIVGRCDPLVAALFGRQQEAA